MFNCCEPLKNKNKYGVDIRCYPVYRVRKCTGSPTGNNCCTFVDDQSRVYKTWQDYLDTNKLPKVRMCVPVNGKYQADENNKVCWLAFNIQVKYRFHYMYDTYMTHICTCYIGTVNIPFFASL